MICCLPTRSTTKIALVKVTRSLDQPPPCARAYARLAARLRSAAPLTNTVGQSQSARRLDRTSHVFYPRRLAILGKLGVERTEVLARQNLEAGRELEPDQVLGRLEQGRLGHLDLELALAETERVHLGNELGHVSLGDHVLPGDAKMNIALSDEAGDVGRGEEHTVKRANGEAGSARGGE